MKFIYALIGMMVGVMPCGAVTTFSFEQDDERGVALSITGEGQPADLFDNPFAPPDGIGFGGLRSPSGIWDFMLIGLAADIVPEPLMHAGKLHMSFSAFLMHAGFERPVGTHPFDEYIEFGDPLFVRELSWDGKPDAFLSFDGVNFFSIDSRPEELNPDSWTWTAGFTFRDTRPVPDAGSTLGMLVMALGGFGFMRRKA